MRKRLLRARIEGTSYSRLMSRRRRLELDERRAQLLALGLSAFSKKSYDDVSVDALAQSAGVSKGLLYHYFPSKRDLYVATVRTAAEQLIARIVPDPTLAPLDQLTHGVDAYLSYVQENADAYLSLMHSGVGRDREVQAIVEETRHQFVALLLARAGEAQLNPLTRTLVRGWVGMVEASSLDWLQHQSAPRAELTSLLVRVLLSTLQLRPTH
jgi:AcrR family transcriptional regulator